MKLFALNLLVASAIVVYASPADNSLPDPMKQLLKPSKLKNQSNCVKAMNLGRYSFYETCPGISDDITAYQVASNELQFDNYAKYLNPATTKSEQNKLMTAVDKIAKKFCGKHANEGCTKSLLEGKHSMKKDVKKLYFIIYAFKCSAPLKKLKTIPMLPTLERSLQKIQNVPGTVHTIAFHHI